MKKQHLITFASLTMMFTSYHVLTNSSGAIPGNTGSPSSQGRTCGDASMGCHAPLTGSGLNVVITTDIPSGGFRENTDYIITITADTDNSLWPLPILRHGFQASVEDPNMGHVGRVSTRGNTDIQVVGSSYITHTSLGTQTGPTHSHSWSFTWNSGTAPDNSYVYAAINFSDGSGTPSGDIIKANSLRLTKAPIGLEENELYEFNLYPNPASQQLKLSEVDPQTEYINIYSITGQKVALFDSEAKESPTSWILNVSQLPGGSYILTTDRKDAPHKNLTIKR